LPLPVLFSANRPRLADPDCRARACQNARRRSRPREAERTTGECSDDRTGWTAYGNTPAGFMSPARERQAVPHAVVLGGPPRAPPSNRRPRRRPACRPPGG
jgi:hypothetical protein